MEEPKVTQTSSITTQTSNSSRVEYEKLCCNQKLARDLKLFKEIWYRITNDCDILDIINGYPINFEWTSHKF